MGREDREEGGRALTHVAGIRLITLRSKSRERTQIPGFATDSLGTSGRFTSVLRGSASSSVEWDQLPQRNVMRPPMPWTR